MTEALAQLEGLERGPAGNISLTAAFVLAQQMERDQTIVVQETEYTGAGKHPTSQLTFARENGVEIYRGDPLEEVVGRNVVIPKRPEQVMVKEVDLGHVRRSLIKNAVKNSNNCKIQEADIRFLMDETRENRAFVENELKNGKM